MGKWLRQVMRILTFLCLPAIASLCLLATMVLVLNDLTLKCLIPQNQWNRLWI